MTDTKDLPGFRLVLGPLVIEWRSLFVAAIKYVPRRRTGDRLPLFERLTKMQETEEPWREGHGAVIRLWPTARALMLGWWGDVQVDDAAGEGRALSSVLGLGTERVSSGRPVSSLPGYKPSTPEELADKVAALLPDDADDDTEYDFEIQDLRNEDVS